jgi:hypothetical protein
LFVLLSANAFCETPAIQRFISSDIAGKVEVLQEASSDTDAGEQAELAYLLYEYALKFVLDNYTQLYDLRDMNVILSISVNGLLKQGRVQNVEVLDTLWQLFLEYPDREKRSEIVIALGVLGRRNSFIVNNLNNYLMEKNLLFRDGIPVDYLIVSACISAIMELGDSSSYPVLFAIICSDYPEMIAFEAYGALEIIPGNLQLFLLSVIENNPPDEKFAAFRAVINSGRLTIPERGQLAELALAQSLLTADNNVDLAAMRYASVLALTQLRWTRANVLAIRHYYRVQADYQQELVPKERFLEAIACLGAVGNSDATLVLVLHLGLINSRTERTGTFDAEITKAIVQALGVIGDNAAFDHLLSVTALPYPDEIIAAAREAIDRLKW